MAMSAEHIYKNLQTFTGKVTSPCEWKILKWDENPRTNKMKEYM